MLPDEIVSEILTPVLRVPDDLFEDLSPISPFAQLTRPYSTSAILLVCKAWLRVSTPLLYSVVVLRSRAQAGALQETLKSNPLLGTFVRKLRLEGGLGPPMKDVLIRTPNITDLYLNMAIRPPDSTSGLIAGLFHINPTRLFVYDAEGNNSRSNGLLQLRLAVEQSAEQWDNLETVVFSFAAIHPCHDVFVRNVCAYVKRVSFSYRRLFGDSESATFDTLGALALNANIEAIEFRNRPHQAALHTKPFKTDNTTLHQLIRWSLSAPAPPRRPASHSEHGYQVNILPPSNALFQPLADVDPHLSDRIWTRILAYTLLSGHVHPVKMRQMSPEEARVRYLLVSKLFYRLAQPIHYAVIDATHRMVHRLAGVLPLYPHLAQHIRTLKIHRESASHPGPLFALEVLLAHTHNLERLLLPMTTGEWCLPWAAFVALANSAGHGLRELTCVMEPLPVVEPPPVVTPAALIGDSIHTEPEPAPEPIVIPPRDPAVFEKFMALQVLEWTTGRRLVKRVGWYGSGLVPGHVGVDELHLSTLASSTLANLRRISVNTPDICPLLQHSSLSRLRCLALHVPDEKDRHPAIKNFLLAHGSKLRELSLIGSYLDLNLLIDSSPFLTLCPRIVHLRLTVRYYHHSSCSLGLLETGVAHEYLRTVHITTSPETRADKTWNQIFAAAQFQAALDRLPALRELHISTIVWPTNAHDIRYSTFVRWSDALRQRKSPIQILDANGKGWIPRLK